METPPHQRPPGYSPTVSSPGTPTPRPERRPSPPQFSSPATSSFSHPRPQQNLAPLQPVGKPGSLPSGERAQTGSSVSQFSNPPRAPDFSSPLRPMPVPFRATPAPPQPVPFSLYSALPISSPSLYSNGSAEQPLQPSAGIDEASFESPYVLFSSHKVHW